MKVLNITQMTRAELIAALVEHDRDGCYTDEANIAEYGTPAETEELRKRLRNQMAEVDVETC